MSKLMIFTIALIVFGFLIIIIYNSLIKLKKRAEEAWFVMDAQLRKRYDIIPKIVAIMEEHAKFDRPVLHAALEARSMAMGVYNIREKIGAESFLSTSLNSLLAIIDKYPPLKADENLSRLQVNLNQIEDAIRSARRVYNDAAQNYNNRLLVFPNNMIAKFFNLKSNKTF